MCVCVTCVVHSAFDRDTTIQSHCERSRLVFDFGVEGKWRACLCCMRGKSHTHKHSHKGRTVEKPYATTHLLFTVFYLFVFENRYCGALGAFLSTIALDRHE